MGSVLVDGSISACPNLRSGFIQGNIYKDSFSDVWENNYQVFRDREWMKTGICKDCKSFRYCDGNGMHLRDEETGEPTWRGEFYEKIIYGIRKFAKDLIDFRSIMTFSQ